MLLRSKHTGLALNQLHVVVCRSTAAGGAVRHQAARFTDAELALIFKKGITGDDSRSLSLRAFFAFSWYLCTRGEHEQYAMVWSDFQLVTREDASEMLRYNPYASTKNYSGGLTQRGPMVRSMLDPTFFRQACMSSHVDCGLNVFACICSGMLMMADCICIFMIMRMHANAACNFSHHHCCYHLGNC